MSRNLIWSSLGGLALVAAPILRGFLEDGARWTPDVAALTVTFAVIAAFYWSMLLPQRFAGTRRPVLAGAAVVAWLDVAFIVGVLKAETMVYAVLLYAAVLSGCLTLLALRRSRTV